MPHLRINRSTRFVVSFSCLLAAAAAYGIQPAEKKPDLQKLVFARPELQILVANQPLEKLPTALGAKMKAELDLLGALEEVKPVGFYDVRAGRLGTIVLSKPLLGKSGIGAMSASTDDQFRRQVWEAFRGYLATHKGQLAIDLEELGSEPRITVLEDRRIVQIHAPRSIDGIPVRGSYVTAVVNSGNLILFGAKQWGDVAVSTQPSLTADAALRKVTEYVRPHRIGGQWRDAHLEILPVSAGDDLSRIKAGKGYLYRLVWAISPRIEEDRGSWEALVDAHSGEILSFADRNSYFDRKIRGGVYPISNDGAGEEGKVQPGWPMPFADLFQPFGTSIFSNSSGLVDDVGGILRTNLDGKYVRMNDACGKIDEIASCSDLDLSSIPGTDCKVPQGHSPGDTHSSRSGFYEVNRIIEQAKAWLPANTWLQDQITANMNIPESCNAFWDGLTINFYQSSAECGNTGEIAAVFDHEWGHGMDDNDALPTISTPGEAPADMYAMLRLNTSCIARGFFKHGFCDGAGDPCTECSGVRDADWAKRSSGLPHDVAWILKEVDSPGVPGLVPPGGCVGATVPIPTVNSGPCLQGTHCEGSVVSEVVWDLVHRDLTAPAFNLDVNTALNLVARLQYLGGGNVDFWFQCDASGLTGGCLADSGYMNYLAIDDDDGNLMNGTPHMTAIFNAFDRHGMACLASPSLPITPVNSGCATKPTIAPNVSVTALGNGAQLTWTAVPNAAKYWVFRADGIHGCAFGKERIAVTTATQYTDTGLLDGREYFYTVEAVGANDSCRSAASACDSVVPTASPVETEALLAFREVPNALTIQSGDGDPFIDNCETSRFAFQVENAGTVGLTNVRLVRVASPSHPDTQILTPLPLSLAANLAGNLCGSIAPASFTFVPQGMSHNEPLDFEFEIQATSTLGPVNLIGRVSFAGNESDFEERGSHTFHFEEESFEGWRTVSGSYTHQTPGANATLTHLASSALQPGQCDEIQSPEIRLTASSTLSLYNQFETEPGTDETGFYDRANVGIFDVATGERSTIVPDGGRLYTASGSGGVCVTAGQPGWAGAGPGFLESTWTAGALGSSALAGKRVRLDVAYGTDPLVEGGGLQFDEVTVTNFELQVPDAQDNTCPVPPSQPDLQVTSIMTSGNRAREGEKVTITARVSNLGTGEAGASMTRFQLDGSTILGTVATNPVAAGGFQDVPFQWDTRSVKGEHTISVTADAADQVDESAEENNTSTLTVTVQGNKIKNGSFEQQNATSTGPNGWSGESTGAGSASWSDGGSDGSKSASVSGNGGNAAAAGSPSWTSDPISVTAGEALTFVVSVSSLNASSAANAGLVYLGAAGNVLQTVNLITAPLTTAGFAKLEQAVTIPAGVTQVRVKLVGFSPADLRTSGTVKFDEVGLFGN